MSEIFCKNKTQRLHDLNTVYNDFKSIIHLLNSGYRFDSEHGAAALKQLEKSLHLLAEEIQILERSDS